MMLHPGQLVDRWRQLPPVPRLLVGTALLILLLYLLRPTAPRQPLLDNAARVQVETARLASLQPRLALFGRVESPSSATLSSSITALVADTPALPGDSVRAGELILQLDPQEAALARAQANAALQQALAQKASARKRHQSDRRALALEQELTQMAEENLARLTRLKDNNLVSQTQLDEARQTLARQRLNLETRQLAVANFANDMQRLNSDIERAQAARDQADLDLSRSSVQAPFAGRITTLHVAIGERVRPGDRLIELYADRNIEIRAQIPASHLGEVRRGLAKGELIGELQLESGGARVRLARLASEVAAGRGGVDGLFVLEQAGMMPELGRPLPMTLLLPPQDDVLALPAAALHGLDRVYRLDAEQRLQTVPVQRVGDWIDRQGRSRILVRGAFNEGDRVVITQLPGAIDGMQVQPTLRGETPVAVAPAADTASDKDSTDPASADMTSDPVKQLDGSAASIPAADATSNMAADPADSAAASDASASEQSAP